MKKQAWNQEISDKKIKCLSKHSAFGTGQTGAFETSSFARKSELKYQSVQFYE